ncbi:MAG: tetratricopeptide repeat protein [Bacteroidetes bacterium]|nr:tetratricopeptide repeat protein [Bacteroidota bacterium]
MKIKLNSSARLFAIWLFIAYCQLPAAYCYCQDDESKLVREGNKKYKENKFNDAEKNYLNALGKKNNSYRGAFNLGDSYFKQGKYKEAAEQFEGLTQTKTSNDTLAKVYHNLGNAYLKQKEFEKSINAYKNALKKNDADEDTRYNLAFAQKMYKQQQEQEQKDNPKKIEPSAYAKKLKEQADKLVDERKYKEAHNLMMEGLKKDQTVNAYQAYIKRIKDVTDVHY